MLEQKHSWLRYGLFAMAIILLLSVFGAIMALVHARIWGYIILVLVAAGLTALWLRGLLRGERKIHSVFKAGLAWVIAITLCAGTLQMSRPDLSVSLSGDIFRNIMAMYINLPSTQAAAITREPISWTPPKGYIHTTQKLGEATLEWITPNRPTGKVVYYLHGGGYVGALLNDHMNEGVRVSKAAGGATVALLDYRVAPEYVFPAALDDALVGWQAVLDAGYAPNDVIVGGASAGGNLTLVLTEALRNKGVDLPAALFAFSPWGDLTETGPSWTENLPNEVGLPKYLERINGMLVDHAYAGDTPYDDPLLSPVFADFSGFPPMLLFVGGDEVVLSDSVKIDAHAREEGVDSTLIIAPGMFHCYPTLVGDLIPESREAWRRMEVFFTTYFSGE